MAIKLNIDKSFFNEAYLPLLNNTERFTVLYGGAGSGKSHFVVQKMIIKALKYPNRKILVIRKVLATVRESMFALFLEQLSNMGILQFCKTTATNMKIVMPNGSTFIFMGLDDSEKIKSIAGIDDIIIEEATEITKDDFSQLNLRLRSKAENQQIHLMFNPVSKSNWVYEYFFVNKPDDCVILKTTYKDNKFLPQSYIDSLLEFQETNPLYFQIYALGEFGNLGKKVYERYSVQDFEVNELIKQNPDIKAVFGLDFGYINDPTAFIAALVDLENRKLYIFDELYERGLLNNEIADRIKEIGYAKETIIADSAEKKSIDEIKGYGIPRIKPARKGSGSIMQGIQFIQQFEILVHPRCKNVLVELENYSYKKDKMTGQYLNQPMDSYNHLLDSLRYALEPFSKGKAIKFLDKSLLGL
ncbi:PBSX family phage terminase large subunit [Neobacillus sedimentimangrovi]|uniref:PBSX family phage terminase large subunit n=1 Tax=Neobacillus sedimentimangrovi TaxID=2699460 RepID=A0ABS8QM01_9BACI|nr:PBSX family phage terminase large subunit [Neobacillus sedimentimangrovi]MCD4839740.1 PBSX family phage terminase large subunit [Neobacillus sedimentimangrovi]